MRIVLAAALLATLAGCNRDGGNAQSNAGGLPTPPSRPPGNGSADLASDETFRQSYRTINIETCVRSGQQRVARSGRTPPDFRAYCTCSIDRLMAGLSVEQLTSLRPGPREERLAEQCARAHLTGAAAPPPADAPDNEPAQDGVGNGGK